MSCLNRETATPDGATPDPIPDGTSAGRRIARVVSMLAAAFALLVSSAAPAGAAGPPLEGSGTGVITGLDVTPIREPGGNRIEQRTLTGVVDGTLVGTFVQDVTGTVHRNDSVTFRGTLVFTGTIAGCGDDVHTLTLGVSGRGHIPIPGFPITDAHVRVIRQPENTLSITGQGVVHQEGPFLTYDIRYTCR
jgi:hypothetical protein